MSALALSTKFGNVGDTSLDAELVEGKTPMIVGNKRFEPAVDTKFKPTDVLAAYFEVYEPLLLEDGPAKPVQLAAVLRVLEKTGGAEKLNSGGVDISQFVRKGNPVVPIALRAPIESLKPGAYTLEIKVQDSAGRTWTRTADFGLE